MIVGSINIATGNGLDGEKTHGYLHPDWHASLRDSLGRLSCSSDGSVVTTTTLPTYEQSEAQVQRRSSRFNFLKRIKLASDAKAVAEHEKKTRQRADKIMLLRSLEDVPIKAKIQLQTEKAGIEATMLECQSTDACDHAQTILRGYNEYLAVLNDIPQKVYHKVYSAENETCDNIVLRAEEMKVTSQAVGDALAAYQDAARRGRAALVLARKFGVKSSIYATVQGKLDALQAAMVEAAKVQARPSAETMVETTLRDKKKAMRDLCLHTLDQLRKEDHSRAEAGKPAVLPHYLKIVGKVSPEAVSEYTSRLEYRCSIDHGFAIDFDEDFRLGPLQDPRLARMPGQTFRMPHELQ